ncbi:MAG: DUF177 domain-containing protein [Caldimicrobium sp.]|nr:DUF177 domain-containing protein [Caldimicrobium sp.]MCX7873768.1 DUF177 domain-containing protein [Caldimicrobium sp.]MDW8093692.1 DUF177 domain-containing protein [Caldimicrobium sp.]
MKNLQDLSSWGVALEEIPPEGLTLEFQDINFLGEDIKIVTPFYGYLRIKKLGFEIEVEGSLKGAIELRCDRCLELFVFPIEETFKVALLPAKSLKFEEERELETEELEVSFYEENFLSFYSVLREEILLTLPFRNLCAVDCKGLCSKCGTNLNRETCSCRGMKKTSPFAILGNLLRKSENTVIREG